MARSKEEIQIDLMTNILREEDRIDVLPGQVVRDVVINGPSAEMENIYAQLDRVSLSQSLANANLMTPQELDDLVFNYGITRLGASKAIGQVTFYTKDQPTVVVTIPKDTKVGTNIGSNGQEIMFLTRYDATFDPASEGNYYNVNSGAWELIVDVIAQTAGDSGNIGAFEVKNLKNINIPFDVTNYTPMSGGENQESNSSLASRTLAILNGSSVGTKSGYEGLALTQTGILDALVVGPEDELMTRDGGFGGKVDIWSIVSDVGIVAIDFNDEPSLQIANFNEGAAFNQGGKFLFPLLPVDAFSPLTLISNSASGVTNALLYEIKNPAPDSVEYMDPSGSRYHYTFIKADDNDTGHSVNANDYIIWNLPEMQYLREFDPSGVAVLSGNTMTVDISYSYIAGINDLQATLDSEDNKILTADVLAKEAQKILIDVEMSITLLPDYTESEAIKNQTIANVVDAIAQTINNNTLGSKLEESDLVASAHNVPGVDNIVLSSVVITRKRPIYFEDTDEQITDDISQPNQYFESDTIAITLVESTTA
jgi:hypothetical protein